MKIESLQMELQSKNHINQEYITRIQQLEEQMKEFQSNENELKLQLSEKKESLIGLKQTKEHALSLKEENENLHIENQHEKLLESSHLREEDLNVETEDLHRKLESLEQENRALRERLNKSEQEKVKMHQDFSEAAMDLLHQEIAETRSSTQENDGKLLRLTTVRSQASDNDMDFNRVHVNSNPSRNLNITPMNDHISETPRDSVHFANRETDEMYLESMKVHERQLSNGSDVALQQHHRQSSSRQFATSFSI